MLDSSPVPIPPAPRPLKRSASVASLPTPPRTHHKRKRSGSKRSRASDDDLTATDEEDDEKLIKDAEDEESFWLSTNSAPSNSNSGTAPLLYRRLQESQTQGFGLPPVSPPPSHYKPRSAATPTPQSATVSPPSTPPPKRRNAAIPFPRDSPDNPFLASPLGSEDEVVVSQTDRVQEEKPTMELVFRGVRRSFPNPHYKGSAPSAPNPNSLLPPEHPDFEPDERGVRKLLFGVTRKTRAPKKTSSKSHRGAVEANSRGRQARRAVLTSKASSAPVTPGHSDAEEEVEAPPTAKLAKPKF
ncbi:hypothetical protein FB45DRAFT_886771 [Roridomyces roridus]|uniref:Uncharacterized protein n=1 Tax=Roridomyces roridus TaxID=1738132 RepID=A0AAD7CJ55_9AGAR|nr:hypothetical protein FB45DRAFT_886771 [Roridomyces roridus]